MNIRRPVIDKRPKVSSFNVQPVETPPVSSPCQGEAGRGEVTFTPEDIEILRQSAERGRGRMFTLGLRGRSYEEERYEFAKDWAEGNHWNTARTRNWAAKIKRELEQMRTRLADHAAPGESSGKARSAR